MNITDNQKLLVLDDVDGNLQSAFVFGVDSTTINDVLASMPFYQTMPPAKQASTKDTVKQFIAALVKTLVIDKPLPVTKFTGTFKALDGSTVTVQDGFIVSVI